MTFTKDPEHIVELRLNVMNMIQAVGYRLQLPQMSIATAMTLFHRFFAKESFESHDVFHIAKTCLFVAGKSEETPRRFRDVLNTAYRYRNPHLSPLEVTDQFWTMKERLFESERLVLRILEFNVEVVHPHSFALHFLRDLKATDNLANLTVAILNDAARIPLCLYYEPHVIACSALYLATELLSVRVGDGDDEWWDRFGAHRTEVETICHEILDIYEQMDRVSAEANAPVVLPTSPKSLHENKLPASV